MSEKTFKVIKFLLIIPVQGLYDGHLMFDSLIGGYCFGQCHLVVIQLKTVEENTCQDTLLSVVIANQARWVSYKIEFLSKGSHKNLIFN